jgi:hypothetical protein
LFSFLLLLLPESVRRADLLDHVKNFYADNLKPGKADAQLWHVISGLLSKHRPGIIRPEKTRKDCKRKALGALGSSSKEEKDKNNNKNNPVWAQRQKAANDLGNRKIIVAQGLGHTMRSKADTKLLCDQLFSSKTFHILDNMTMSAAIESNSFAIYIGTMAGPAINPVQGFRA